MDEASHDNNHIESARE